MPISPYLAALRRKVGHELLMVPSVSIAPFDQSGRVCLVQTRETGTWQTIGGAIEPLESPAEAAVREALEETGLVVELLRVMGVFSGPAFQMVYPNGDRCVYVSTLFEARVVGGTARPDGEETSAVRWFGEDEVGSLPMAPISRHLLREAFRHDSDCLFGPAAV